MIDPADLLLDRIVAHSQEVIDRHHAAVAWRDRLAFPASLIWLDTAWALHSDQIPLRETLLSGESRRRIEQALRQDNRALNDRAVYALCDRLALRAAARLLAPLDHQSILLSHTPLGQPITLRDREPGPLQISFTHDGDMHLTLAASHPGLKGVGIDVVHLSRLRGERKGRDYLHRFAQKFMSGAEYTLFAGAALNDDEESLRIRVAAHFSLMESASKALGTGLKIGVGMGTPESLPKQSLGIAGVISPVEFLLAAESRARIQHLNASNLTGTWSASEEYLVSAAIVE